MLIKKCRHLIYFIFGYSCLFGLLFINEFMSSNSNTIYDEFEFLEQVFSNLSTYVFKNDKLMQKRSYLWLIHNLMKLLTSFIFMLAQIYQKILLLKMTNCGSNMKKIIFPLVAKM